MSKTVTLEVHQENLARSTEEALDLIEKNKGHIIGKILTDTARTLAPVYQGAGGGTLQASIQPIPCEREGDTVTCGFGTNVEYAVYQEYGTGYKSDCAKHTPKLYWRYKSDRDGQWHTGKPMKAKRFMRDSVEMNEENIRNLLAEAFTEVLL